MGEIEKISLIILGYERRTTLFQNDKKYRLLVHAAFSFIKTIIPIIGLILNGGMKQFLSIITLSLFLLASAVRRTSAEPIWNDVCTQDETKDLPFCDMTLKIDERVTDYVKRVPTEVQISMMGHNASGYEALEIPPYMWWSEGLHGPLEPCVRYKDSCVCPSNFPSPSAMGSAFNRTLYSMVGRAIGIEGRAISNLRDHDREIGDGLTYW